jgi:A/G-specific adenine glycosylase
MTKVSNLNQAPDLATRVVDWQARYGRHDLPWQNTHDPYRVWLSEIMLQQTQVSTVLEYFPRFLQRFPNVAALAAAPLDDVLGLWSGLGYYSRARNLHQCACQVMAHHGGAFPRSAELLQTLPGIGRSTAAAIASLCFFERVAILDGNVKRVLTRFLGFEHDLALSRNERTLWDEATRLLPLQQLTTAMPRYTQGVMDLGATLCTSKKPRCSECPLATDCAAHRQGTPEKFPVKTRKLKRSAQSLWLLWARTDDGQVWLSKRPTPGVWAGLYCFPLFDSLAALHTALPTPYLSQLRDLEVFTHVLTHKDLHLHPVQLKVSASGLADLPELSELSGLSGISGGWIAAQAWPGLGLPAPVRKLMAQETL